jgi:two-component system OmpR family response regulator/two-component system response regulator RstA
VKHILVVEDDSSIAEWISDYLISHGYQISVANRGDTAVEMIVEDRPDLVLLDIMLPKKNGFDVCKEVRAFYHCPILIMTACNEEADEVLGLELGADDYINKPVKLRVLLARIKALLRRGNTEEQDLSVRVFGSLRMDSKSKTATINGKVTSLSTNEFDVLWLLASHAGQVVSRDELVSQLRGFDYNGFDRTMDIRVSRLRKKLDDCSDHPYKIKTIWGKGYLFVGDAW